MGWDYLAGCWTWQRLYVQKADMGTVTNTAGDGFDIPLVNNLQAGLMAPGDKNKLDTYPDDAADLAQICRLITEVQIKAQRY